MSKSFSFALIGTPLSHSLSPRLHQAALKYAHLEGEYKLCEIAPSELREKIEQFIAAGVNGFNVTIPYKQALFEMVKTLTSSAEQTGALNAVKIDQSGQLIGHNTDFPALKFIIEKNHPDTTRAALILGAGGGAKAAACAIKELGFSNCYIFARDQTKQRHFIDFMQKGITIKPLVISNSLPESFSLVINATSIGLKDEAPPEWMSQLIKQLPNDCFCYDLVYKKDKTSPIFTELANRNNLKSQDGLDMLIEQARLSFQYWTGISVPFTYLKESLD